MKVQLNHVVSATMSLLKVFRFDTHPDETQGPDSYAEVPLLEVYVHGSHPMPRYNHSSYALTLWENVPLEGPVKLQDCQPLAVIVARLQGEGMADLLYTDCLPALHGCCYMKILWLQFRMEVGKMQGHLTVKQTALLARQALLDSGHGKRKRSDSSRQAALLGKADPTVYPETTGATAKRAENLNE
ncbi:hypothetical protein WJX77_002650 [Trebouxia sp. C0004]